MLLAGAKSTIREIVSMAGQALSGNKTESRKEFNSDSATLYFLHEQKTSERKILIRLCYFLVNQCVYTLDKTGPFFAQSTVSRIGFRYPHIKPRI